MQLKRGSAAISPIIVVLLFLLVLGAAAIAILMLNMPRSAYPEIQERYERNVMYSVLGVGTLAIIIFALVLKHSKTKIPLVMKASAAIIVLIIMTMALVGMAFVAYRLYVGRYGPHEGDTGSWEELFERYYVEVSGIWDPSSGTGSITEIVVSTEALSSMAVGEGGTTVEVVIRGLDGTLLKSKKEPIGEGSWTVYVDVTEYRGRTVKVTARLIDERIGPYGIPQPVIVAQKTIELTIRYPK